MRHVAHSALLLSMACVLASCTVHPPGETNERAAATQAGKIYELPREQRTVPPLSVDAGPNEFVQYALLTNADVEARYWEWRSALEQVPREGTQKTNLSISFTSMITNGATASRLNSIGLGNDAMNNIVLPGKLNTAAALALNNARAAGFRFDQAQFELRAQVLSAYDDYALTAALIGLADENDRLISLTSEMLKLRIESGAGSQPDFLRSSNELATSKNDQETLRAKSITQLAALNLLLNRNPQTPITPPKSLPNPAMAVGSDSDILRRAARNNPQAQELAAELAGRTDAIKLAKQDYLPEFGVNVSTDLAGVTQSLLGSVMIPALRYEAIDAGIRQAEDNLRASEAMQHHFHHQLAARVVTDLATIRDAERQIALFENALIPRTQQILSAAQVSYAANQSSMLDLLDTQRSLIALRRLVAELKVYRAKQLADLEGAIGPDSIKTNNSVSIAR